MKQIAPFLTVVVIIFLIIGLFLSLGQTQNMIVIREGNVDKVPLEMELNRYQDSDCGMVIEDLHYASQVVAPNGKTWFFHDHGGFIHWLSDKDFQDDAVIWVMSRDSKRWIDARAAYYSLTDTTPMGYGFGAYETKQTLHVEFEAMRLKMLRGETLNNPLIRKKLLGI